MMKVKSTYITIAIAFVFTVFVFQANKVFGQEDLLNHNNWLVNNPIANNVICADQTICCNSIPAGLTGSVPTGGSGYYTYQWQESHDGVTGHYIDIFGSTNQNYAPGPLDNTTWFRRIAMSPNSTNSISNVLQITVYHMISYNVISADQTINSGDIPASLTGTIPIGGNGTYTYRWQNSTIGVAGPYNDIMGAIGQNYQPPALVETTWYRRVVSSPPVGNSNSNVVTITVNTSDIIPVCPVLGINGWGKEIKLQLFPNPTNDFIEFKLNGYSGNMKISLLNTQGKILFTNNISVNEDPYLMKIDLAKFNKGVYFIQIITNNGISVNKIIKQ